MNGKNIRGALGSTLVGLLLFAGAVEAGDPVEGKNNPVNFSGKLWARYSYLLEGTSADSTKSEDDNAFLLDRVYLTFSSKLGERFTGRARVEMKNLNTGNSTIFVKTADITVHEPFGIKKTSLRFGQTVGSIAPFLEKPWGYRVVSKTTIDRYLGVSTTYLGAGVNSRWLDGILATDLLVANRASFSQDMTEDADSKYKTISGRAYLQPIQEGPAKGLGFGGYGRFAPKMSPSSDNNSLWYGGHAFFEGRLSGRPLVVGVQYDSRTDRAEGIDPSDSVSVIVKETPSAVISGFARIYVTDRIELFGRVDLFDPDTDRGDLVVSLPDGTVAKEGDRGALPAYYERRLARTVLMAGVSHAYTATLRGILDVSVQSYTDELLLEKPGHTSRPADIDNEIILSARLEAKL